MKLFSRLLVLAALVAAALYMGPPPARADSGGWPQDRGDAARTGSRVVDVLPTGRVAWRLDFESHLSPMLDASPVVAPSSTAGTIYIGGSGSDSTSPSLLAINPNGTLKWSIRLDVGGFHYKVRTTPGIRIDNKMLTVVGYRKVGSGDSWSLKGRVFWVNPSGTVVRVSPEYDGVGLSSPLVWADDAYVFSHPGGSDDLLRGFSLNTFDERWVGGINYGGLTGGYEGCPPACYMPWHPLRMYGFFDPDTKPLFPSPSKDMFGNADIVQPSAKTARFWVGGGQVWQRDVIGLTTAPTVAGDSFFGAASEFNAYRATGLLEARNAAGNRAWALNPGGFPSGIAYSDSGKDHIYFTATNGTISSYRVTGERRWAWTLSNPGAMGAPVVAKSPAGELVIVGDSQGRLWAFDVNGQTQWTINLDSPALGSPAIADGRIYVATQKSLFAIS
jgi:putative pyrroloquinoline-quinone binding quinoprotein